MAECGISLQELTVRYELSQDQLDMEFSEGHVTEVSKIIDNPEIVGPALKLPPQVMSAVKADGSNLESRKVLVVERWMQKNLWKATYRALIEAFLKCDRADHARVVCELLKKSQRLPSPQYSSGNYAYDSSESSSGYGTSNQNYTGKEGLAQPKQEEITAPISDDEHLKCLLQLKFNRMKTLYEVLLKSCSRLFKEGKISLEEVREKAMDYHKQLQINCKRLCKMSMDEIRAVIKERTSWHNSHVVEDLVKLNGDDRAHESLKEFQKFRNELVQFLKCNEEAGKKAKMVLKLEEDFEKFTEKKLEQVCLMVCDLLNTTACPLRVQEGCVQITMSIPAEVAEDIFPLSPAMTKAFQKAFPTLISVSCGRTVETFETTEDTDDSLSLDGQENCLDEGFNEDEYFADGSGSDEEECGKKVESHKKTTAGGTSLLKFLSNLTGLTLLLVMAVLLAGLMWPYGSAQWNVSGADPLKDQNLSLFYSGNWTNSHVMNNSDSPHHKLYSEIMNRNHIAESPGRTPLTHGSWNSFGICYINWTKRHLGTPEEQEKREKEITMQKKQLETVKWSLEALHNGNNTNSHLGLHSAKTIRCHVVEFPGPISLKCGSWNGSGNYCTHWTRGHLYLPLHTGNNELVHKRPYSVDSHTPLVIKCRDVKKCRHIYSSAKGDVMKLSCEMCTHGWKAVAFCRHCEEFNFCVLQVHKTMKQYVGQQAVRNEDLTCCHIPVKKPNKMICRDSEFTWYCYGCVKLICCDCIMRDHRDHDCEYVKHAAPKCRDILKGRLGPCQQVQQMVANAAEKVHEGKREVENQEEGIVAKTATCFNQVVEMLKYQKEDKNNNKFHDIYFDMLPPTKFEIAFRSCDIEEFNKVMEATLVYPTQANLLCLAKGGIIQFSCEMCTCGMKIIAFCCHCKELGCNFCVLQVHKSMKQYVGQQAVRIEDLTCSHVPVKKSTKMMCRDHEDSELTWYCYGCVKLICRDCIVRDHRDRDCEYVKHAAPKCRDMLKGRLGPCRQVQQTVANTVKKLYGEAEKPCKQGHEFQKKRVIFMITPSFDQAKIKPKKSVATKMNIETSFSLQAIDARGEPFQNQHNVVAPLKSQVNNLVAKTMVLDKGKEMYEATYRPRFRGWHIFEFKKYMIELSDCSKVEGIAIGNCMTETNEKQINTFCTWRGIAVSRDHMTENGTGMITFLGTDTNTGSGSRHSLEQVGEVKLKTGIASDDNGSFYVVDAETSSIYFLHCTLPDGALVKKIGGRGRKVREFQLPGGVRVYRDRVVGLSQCAFFHRK